MSRSASLADAFRLGRSIAFPGPAGCSSVAARLLDDRDIETLQLQPAPVARGLIDAVEVLREMNRDSLREVPPHAPLSFCLIKPDVLQQGL